MDSDDEPEPRPVDRGVGRRPTCVEGVKSAGVPLCTGKDQFFIQIRHRA